MANPGAEAALLQVAQQIEAAIDDELDRVDHMGEDDLMLIRRKRLQQLQEMQKRKEIWVQKGHGVYREVAEPKQFFEYVKGSERVIVHFFRRETMRCQIIERHFRELAPKHFETLFIFVDVEKFPHIASQYNVVMLPHIMLIEKQQTFHSIIGFDDFGGRDEFPTERVEEVLCHYGMLNDKDMFAADQSDD